MEKFIAMEWEDYYKLAKKFYKKNGHLLIPNKFKTKNGYEYDEDGFKLGEWLQKQRTLYSDFDYPTERIKQLEDIGMEWESVNTRFVNKTFNERLENKEYSEKIDVPSTITPDMLNLDDLKKENYESMEDIESDFSTEIEGEKSALRDEISKALEKLNDRERTVLIGRYGLDGGPTKTLQELSNDIGVSVDSIRQIEAKAIHKLRKNRKNIEDFYEEDDLTRSWKNKQKLLKKLKDEHNHDYDALIDFVAKYENTYTIEQIDDKELTSLCYYHLHITKKDFKDILNYCYRNRTQLIVQDIPYMIGKIEAYRENYGDSKPYFDELKNSSSKKI